MHADVRTPDVIAVVHRQAVGHVEAAVTGRWRYPHGRINTPKHGPGPETTENSPQHADNMRNPDQEQSSDKDDDDDDEDGRGLRAPQLTQGQLGHFQVCRKVGCRRKCDCSPNNTC